MAELRASFLRWVASRLGARVRCRVCGATLFRGFALLARGELKILGADEAYVRIDFETPSRVVFEHAELGACLLGGARIPGAPAAPDARRAGS